MNAPRTTTLLALLVGLAAASAVPVAGQLPDTPPPVLVELGALDAPLAPGALAELPFQVTLQCTEFFQPTPGSKMEIAYNATVSSPAGVAFVDPPNATLGADLVNCPPSEASQTNGTLFVLLGAASPAFTTVDVVLEATVTSGNAEERGSDNTTVEVAYRSSLSVSVGSDEATVPPGGNLTVKINVVNNGNAPVTATAQLARFEGTGSLTQESFTLTFPVAQEIGSRAAGDESNLAIFEVVVQTPSGGLFVGEEGTFTFNVTANPTERADLDGGSGEVDYKVLVQGTKKDGDGGGKKKGGLPGFEAPLFAVALMAAAFAARRAR